jgi:hypothetical protein
VTGAVIIWYAGSEEFDSRSGPGQEELVVVPGESAREEPADRLLVVDDQDDGAWLHDGELAGAIEWPRRCHAGGRLSRAEE